MEAESYHANVVAPDGHEWLPAGASYPGFAGTDALRALPADSVVHVTGYSTLSPRLDYPVNFVATGTHYVWVRAWGPTAGSNSLHMGLDGQELATGENMAVPAAVGYVWVSTILGGARATIDIGTAGEHTVDVWMRESGTVVDKVVLTTDPDYDPSTLNGGLGPDESVQINPTDADLSVGVGVDDATPVEGQSVVYTVSVTNQGLAAATGVALTDQLPAGLTYVSDDAAGTGTVYTSSSGVWTVGNVPVGQTVSLNLTASVDAGTGGTVLSNTAAVSALNELDPVPGNDSASVSVAVVDPNNVDLSVALAVDDTTPLEGSTVVYTVTVTNQGPGLATGVELTDQLPVGLTYVSDDAAGTGTVYTSSSGVWTVGALSAGQTLSLNLTVSVDAGTGASTLSNTASVSGVNEPDLVPGNDSASVSVTVVDPNNVDLSVVLAVDDTIPLEGSTVVYTVTVTNQGPGVATGVELTDQLPVGLTYVSDDAAGTGTVYTSSSGVWTVGALSAGQTVSLNLTASVDAGTGASTLSNTASVSGVNEPDLVPGNDSASVSVTVAVPISPFLQDSGVQGVVSLEAESYHASVVALDGHEWLPAGASYPGFAGTDALRALPADSVVHVTGYSTLSPRLDYQVNFVATGTHYVWVRAWGPTAGSNSLHVGLDGQELATGENMDVPAAVGYVWVSTILGGARATIDIGTAGEHTVNVWMRESGTVVDKVVLTTDPVYDPSTLNGGLGPDESVQINPTDADLSVGVGVDDATPVEGQSVVYTVSVTNQGLAAATGVALTDQLPTGLTYVSDDAASTGTFYDSGSGVWTVGNVPVGQTVSLNLTASVDAGTGGTVLSNTAAVSALNELDPVPGNDSASVSVAVVDPNNVDLSVALAVDDTTPLEGSTVVYTVTVTNQGPGLATGVELTDQLPVGLTYVSDDAAGTGTVYTSSSGVWTVGALSAGQTLSLNLTVSVDAGTGASTLSNTASVSGVNEPDLVPGNDSASVSVTVVDPNNVDLSVVLAVDDTIPPEGSTVVYTVTVTNQSSVMATGVALTDQLPAGLTYVSDDASTGTLYDSGSGVWTVGTVLAGQTVSLNLTASVDAGTAGSTLTNTASVSGVNETDPVPGNDSASVSVTVAVPSIPFRQDGGVQGVVSMEAESYHASVVAPDGHEWLSAGASYPGFAGTDALRALPADSVVHVTGYSTLSPRLDCQVNFVATGTHYVWVRAWGPSTSSNSMHVGLDGQELATGENMDVPAAVGYVWVSTILGGARATIDIGTAGEHTVNVWMRESGTVVDKVVLTTDPDYDPSTLNGGLGPDESVQINPTDADLSVGVGVDDSTPVEGQSVVYTVSVTNQGPATATGVALTDQLPTGLTYVSDDAASTGTFYDSGSGVWTVGNVPVGQTVSLNLTANVDAGTGGTVLSNTAAVSALNELDPVTGNDSVSVSVAVVDPNNVDLSVALAVDDTTPLEGSTVVYAVTVTNQGPAVATGVALIDQLPAGLTYVSDDAASTGTFYDSGSGVWTVGALSAGQTLSLNLTASVDAGTSGQVLMNTASVNGLNETDSVSGNDSASVAVTVAVSSIPFRQDGGAQGVVSLEAESYYASVVAPDGHEWLSAGASYPGFAGTDALQALPEDSVNYSTGYATLSPQLDYQVNFVATGTHYVWVRAWGPSTSSNSVHVGLDGQALTTGEYLNVVPVAAGYVWVGTRSVGSRATLDISTVGVHTVNVWPRETGTVIDKVVLTTDASYDPATINAGLGPDESVRETGSTVEKPTISPDGGVFSSSVFVTLASDTPGAAIYYTLDGSDPTLSSNEYTGSFLLTVTATLKARAFFLGYVDSAIEIVSFQLKPLPSGLDLYLPFNEVTGLTFTDTVAGVTASCVSCPTPVSGRVSGAQLYDGIDDEVNIPGVGLFDWANTDRFSLEVWVNKSSACVGSESIIGRHEASSQLHWWLGCDSGVAAFTLIDGGGVGATISGTTNIADGQWHHLVAVRDAIGGDIRLYVDGVEEATADIGYAFDFAGVVEVNIGWLNDSAMDYHFAGTIDEIALHSRVLTHTEISRHYMDGAIGLRRGYWGCESPVRIMPLGDSITNIQGYRPPLYFDLVDAGYDVDFVGSKTDSSGSHDRNHEGHGGFTTSDIAVSLNSWLTQNPSDAILLHIGTNEDPAFPYPSTGGVEILHNIVDTFDPNISIVQARIINRVPYEPLVTQFNDNVVAMVAARVANGENITIADHESALNYIDDMNSDGIHPIQAGFDKMVPVWFDGLTSFLPACNQTLPQTTSQAITSADVGVPYEYQLETSGFPNPDFLLLAAPAGMTIHPDTGQINWTPGVTGSVNVSVQVQNLAGTTTHDFAVSVSSSSQDTDADGMIDSWEIANFGDLSRDGSGDFDFDGASDLEEHNAGTDPLDPASFPANADLSVGMVVDAATPVEGQQVVYTVTVTNNGPSDATGVALTDMLPLGLTYVGDDAVSTGTSYNAVSGVWTVGGVSNGQARVLNITASVDAGAGGSTLTNTASVSGLNEPDLVSGNDSASVDVTVSVPSIADGDINGDGQVNVADVLLAQQIALGVYIPTAAEFQRADVAPLIGGVPSSDGEINAGDFLLIQRKALGLVNF